MIRFKNILSVIQRLIHYNLRIIFANKFIYFLIAALFVFSFIIAINLMNEDAQFNNASMFWYLLVPGILLIFYPVTFGIQNDVDSRVIDVLFGIPNYRYKVWLVRLVLMFMITFVILFCLSNLSSFLIVTIPVTRMVYHLMVPVVFFGCLAFMLSTLFRDGSGTAVVMILITLGFWLGRQFFQSYPQLDIFFNPFAFSQNISDIVWTRTIIDNRVYLLAASILATLYGLLNLQKREKFF